MSCMKNTISVIVPVYNTARYLPEALDSILAQTLAPLEIIVVDDGSTDNINEVVTPYLDKVIFIRKENGGISSAYNAGIKASKGEWIAICDGDDFWEKDKLEIQSGLMDEEAGFIFCNKVHFYESGAPAEEFSYPPNMVRHPLKSLLKSFFASPSTVLIRRPVFERCGYFNTTLPSSEDYDMWIRVAAEGYAFRLSSRYLTHKRIRNTSIQRTQGSKVLIPLVFEVLMKHEGLFRKKLHLSKAQFYWRIGFNYGYIVKMFLKKKQLGLTLTFLGQSFRTSLVSGAGAIYRSLFKKQSYLPWYE